MPMTSLVDMFVRVTLAHPEADLDELIRLLQSENIDPEMAERLVAFVPMAFAHVILGALGVRLPDGFVVRDPDTGRSAHGKLLEEPIFVAACVRARTMHSVASETHLAREIASASAEWATIAHLTRDGSDPAACGLTEPLLMRLSPDYLNRGVHTSKPWWNFWSRPG